MADGLERHAVPVTGTGFDFDDHEHPAVHGDDVDLAVGAPPVPVEHRGGRAAEVLGGEVLTVPAEGVLRVHGNHLRVRRCRLGRGGGGRDGGLWTGTGERC